MAIDLGRLLKSGATGASSFVNRHGRTARCPDRHWQDQRQVVADRPALGRRDSRRTARERGRAIKCLSNAKQVGLAFQLYIDDHELIPPGRVAGFTQWIVVRR